MKSEFAGRSFILELEQFVESYHIPMNTLVGARISKELILGSFFDGFEARITAYIAQRKVEDRKVTFPTTWIDALKNRFMPLWLQRFFPVSYTTIEVKVAEIASKLKVPEKYGPIYIMTWDERKFSSRGTDE